MCTGRCRVSAGLAAAGAPGCGAGGLRSRSSLRAACRAMTCWAYISPAARACAISWPAQPGCQTAVVMTASRPPGRSARWQAAHGRPGSLSPPLRLAAGPGARQPGAGQAQITARSAAPVPPCSAGSAARRPARVAAARNTSTPGPGAATRSPRRPRLWRSRDQDGGQVCQRPPRGSPTSRASNARSAFGHQGQASARFGEVWCALEDLDLPTVPDLPSLLPAGGQAPGTVRILRLSRPALMPRRGGIAQTYRGPAGTGRMGMQTGARDRWAPGPAPVFMTASARRR